MTYRNLPRRLPALLWRVTTALWSAVLAIEDFTFGDVFACVDAFVDADSLATPISKAVRLC